MATLWRKLKRLFLSEFSDDISSKSTPGAPTSLRRRHQTGSPPSSTATSRSSFSRRLSRSLNSAASTSSSSKSSSSSSSKKTCTICLGDLKSGDGQGIFTAECSHSFHFDCIASNVKHGNHLCPICRCKWKDIPLRFATRSRNVDPSSDNAVGQNRILTHQGSHEPRHFSDDEPLLGDTSTPLQGSCRSVIVKTSVEVPAIAASKSVSSFAVLVGVRAPPLLDDKRHLERAPVDLVIVLDVSGSMSGSKFSLLKRAACFLIENLAASDRLSVVTFSSDAQRVLPLRRMTDIGREDAKHAINSLSSSGGTNIVQGLRKGVRILEEWLQRNQTCSIILLSDGRDTYNGINDHCLWSPYSQNSFNQMEASEYLNRLFVSICSNNRARDGSHTPTIPVHTFGFGSDHDATVMHAISDASGGTFSFIESVDMIQDAFARCIGGLLSVVAQDLKLIMTSLSPEVEIGSISSGKYAHEIFEHGKKCVINVGDLYADEEKEFLAYVSIPVFSPSERNEMVEKTLLLSVVCPYKDSFSRETVHLEGKRTEIHRPKLLSHTDLVVSLEVDRQRNRLWVAEDIAEAQRTAEMGDLDAARAILANRRSALLSSASAQAGDDFCSWLEIELAEIMDRISSMESYKHTGRAYMLSGLSSHSWQRATTRGDSTTQTTMFPSGGGLDPNHTTAMGYNTPSMVSMVSKSQNLSKATLF